MNTEHQGKRADYLSSPRVGGLLQSMADLTQCCLAVTNEDGAFLHLRHESSGRWCASGNCALAQEGGNTGVDRRFLRQPLLCQGEALGELRLSGRRPAEELALLAVAVAGRITDTVSHEYEIDNLSSEILSKYEELNVLYDVGESLHIKMNREEICRLAVEKVRQVAAAGRTAVLLRDDDDQPFRPMAGSGGVLLDDEDGPEAIVMQLASHVAGSGKALLADSPESFPPDLVQRLGTAALAEAPCPLLVAPINRGEHLLGVLLASEKPEDRPFTANDLKLVLAICSQAAVAISNLQMLDELKKTEALKREMDIARNIQMKMLPAQPLEQGSVIAAGRCITAANVGGDYYDHIGPRESGERENDLVHLLIADVSGHDLGAALMMSVGRKVFHTAVRGNLDPPALMREFNRVMHDDLSASDLFITMFYAQYSHASRLLRFTNAGHNPPFLVRGSDGSVETMDTDGMIVGVLEDVDFGVGEVHLRPGDLAVFYTDGVTETENQDAEQFGLQRFHRLVREHRDDAPDELLDVIYDRVRDYSGGADQYDDITVLILKDTG